MMNIITKIIFLLSVAFVTVSCSGQGINETPSDFSLQSVSVSSDEYYIFLNVNLIKNTDDFKIQKDILIDLKDNITGTITKKMPPLDMKIKETDGNHVIITLTYMRIYSLNATNSILVPYYLYINDGLYLIKDYSSE